MATADSISDISAPSPLRGPGLLVLLASMPPEQLDNVLANLTACYPAEDLIVATPDAISSDSWPNLRVTPLPAPGGSWTLTANDFMNAYQLAAEHDARAVLVLGSGAASLRPSALRELSGTVIDSITDLAIPCYDLPPRAGLVNSAILYPLTRALFPSRARFPLAVDLGFSLRMAERLAVTAQRFTSLNQRDALIWPLNEAAVAGFTNSLSVSERYRNPRRLTSTPSWHPLLDLCSPTSRPKLLSGSVLASFWQRAVRWLRHKAPMRPRKSVQCSMPSNSPSPISRKYGRSFCRPTRFSDSSGSQPPVLNRFACRMCCGSASSMTFCWPIGSEPSIADICSARSFRSIWRGSPAISISPHPEQTLNAISKRSPPPLRLKSPISFRAGDGPTGSTHERDPCPVHDECNK